MPYQKEGLTLVRLIRLCLLLRSISGIKISIYSPENEWSQFLPMDIFNSPTIGLEWKWWVFNNTSTAAVFHASMP